MARYLAGIHSLALLAAWLNPLNLWFKLVLSAGVLVSFGLNVRRIRAVPEIVGLRPKANGVDWDLYRPDGTVVEASLLGSSRFNQWFVLLHFRANQKRHNLLICRDGLDPESFRRLRLALRVLVVAQ